MMKKECAYCKQEFQTNRSARKYCSPMCSNRANGEKVALNTPPGKKYIIWSSGGGIQSTAIAALIEQGRLPKPDYGIMIDCGYERESTMRYMQEITIPKMKAVGVPFEIIKTMQYTNNQITDGKGHVNIPAYKRLPDGKISKLSTHCNNTWKVRVAYKWIREHGIDYCVNWLGISTDEMRRAKQSKLKWCETGYPLIDLGMNREDCIYTIAQAGWPMPSRTSCFFCPQQNDASWRNLKEQCPREWEDAIRIEKQIQLEAPNVFLFRNCIPLEDLFPSPPMQTKSV